LAQAILVQVPANINLLTPATSGRKRFNL